MTPREARLEELRESFADDDDAISASDLHELAVLLDNAYSTAIRERDDEAKNAEADWKRAEKAESELRDVIRERDAARAMVDMQASSSTVVAALDTSIKERDEARADYVAQTEQTRDVEDKYNDLCGERNSLIRERDEARDKLAIMALDRDACKFLLNEERARSAKLVEALELIERSYATHGERMAHQDCAKRAIAEYKKGESK